MKKLLFLTKGISDGGVETLIKDYINAIDRNKFEIILVSDSESDIKSSNYRFIKGSKISFISPFYHSSNRIIQEGICSIINWLLVHIFAVIHKNYASWYVKRKIVQIKPNIIHAHLNVLYHLVPISTQIKDCKLFYTCHNEPKRCFVDYWNDEYYAAKYLIENNKLVLIGLHDEMRLELDKMFGVSNTIVLYNCVDFGRFEKVKKHKDKKTLRKRYGIPEDSFVIGNIGRLTWVKNQMFLVDIFERYYKYNPKAFLILVGNGNNNDIKLKLAYYGLTSRCLFLSNRQDIPELLKCMDAFVFPSFYEGFPIACIEAQVMDLKCIISSKITKEVILTPKTIMADINEGVASWVKLILDNYENPSLRRHSIEEFDIKHVIPKLEEIYNN